MRSIAVVMIQNAVNSRDILLLAALFVLFALVSGCETSPERKTGPAQVGQATGTADDFLVVDCLLPGRLQKLGGKFTYLTQRQPIKTAQSDCEIRGGEYVAFDRANYSTALKIWLPLAQAGDPAAQTYVGEIYEKGLGLSSDYQVAAHWYGEAVKLGYSRAQINLGHLYEKGLGVEQDKQEALNLYRSASGLGADNLMFASTLSTSYVPRQEYETVQRELVREQRRSDQLKQEIGRISKELNRQTSVLSEAEQQLSVTQVQLEQAVADQSTASAASGRSDASEGERELQSTVAKMEGFQVDLEQQITQLKAQNGELTRSQRALVEQLSGNELAKNQYRQQIAQLEQQMASSKSDLTQSEKTLAASREKLAAQQSRDNSLTPEILGLQQELEAKNQALTEELVKEARIESERSSLAQQLSTTDKRLSQYQQQIDQMQQQLAKANTQLGASEAEAKALSSRLQEQLDQDAELTPALAAAKYDLDDKNRALASQRQKYAALEREKEALANQLGDSQEQKAGYSHQASQLQKQLVTAADSLSQAEAEVLALNNKLAAVQDRESSLTPEVIALQTELAQNNRKLTASKVNFAALESQNHAERRQLAEALDELDRKSQQLTATENNYRGDIRRLDVQLAERELQATQIRHELLLAKASLIEERANSEDALAAQAGEHDRVVQKQQSELEQLTSQFETQFELVKSQRQQIASLKLEAEKFEMELAAADDAPAEPYLTVADNGPMIEIIEPPVVLTRSEATVRLSTFRGERQVIGKVFSPSGILSLSVNGETPKLTDNNLFRLSIPLTDDPTPVEVVLVDNDGRRAAVTFSFIDQQGNDAGLKQEPMVATARYDNADPSLNIPLGDYHALIIGNNQYENYSTLVTAVNDARETEKILREKYRFKTTLLLDANRYEILSALNELRESLDKDDNLLIYYAGHGKIDEGSNTGYWLPVDAAADNNINWISNGAITDILSVIEAKHILVVADSCYAGTLSQTPIARIQTDIPQEARAEWLKSMAETRTRITLTSGGVEPVLDGGGGRNSVFAKAFLGALRSNKKILEGYTLYSRVLEVMASQASPLDQPQTPLYAPIHLAGHEAGEFFFNPARG